MVSYDNVHRRDNTMLRVVGRPHESFVLDQIVTNHRASINEGTTMR